MGVPFPEQSRRLKALRSACFKGTQEKFGKKFGCAKGHWSDFENGKRELTLEVARRIQAEYRIPIQWLLEGDEWALQYAPAHYVNKIEAYAA